MCYGCYRVALITMKTAGEFFWLKLYKCIHLQNKKNQLIKTFGLGNKVSVARALIPFRFCVAVLVIIYDQEIIVQFERVHVFLLVTFNVVIYFCLSPLNINNDYGCFQLTK